MTPLPLLTPLAESADRIVAEVARARKLVLLAAANADAVKRHAFGPQPYKPDCRTWAFAARFARS